MGPVGGGASLVALLLVLLKGGDVVCVGVGEAGDDRNDVLVKPVLQQHLKEGAIQWRVKGVRNVRSIGRGEILDVAGMPIFSNVRDHRYLSNSGPQPPSRHGPTQ